MKKFIVISLVMLFSVSLMVLPAVAKEKNRLFSSTTPPIQNFDPTCIKNAIEKRDTAMINAVTVKSNAVVAALGARKEALKKAWDLTDQVARKEAQKKAWNEYKDLVRNAQKTFKETKQSTWRQFYADRKACGTSSVKFDFSEEGIDSSL